MLNIAFFGTSDRTQPILESLKTNFNLVLCVTKTDSKIGRKQEVKETQVKKWAKENNVHCVEIDSLKENNLATVIEALRDMQIQLAVIADFSILIPMQLISTPPNGMINIHFSLLPKYRGASPMQHAILNNEPETGITFQLIDAGMDTGAILYQQKIQLPPNTYAEELSKAMFQEAARLLPEVITSYIAKTLHPVVQEHTQATYCYSPTKPKSTLIFKEDSQIDWAKHSLADVNSMVHAYYPWPATYTTISALNNVPGLYIGSTGLATKPGEGFKKIKLKAKQDLRLKIYRTTLLSDILQIEEVQLEGKNKMDWKSFYNGYFIG